jgi:glycosyltransferase involved in cell wall biosynthesis
MILEEYGENFIWYSLRGKDHSLHQPIADIPYEYSKQLRRPSRRFSFLRQYLNLGPWARVRGWWAARFGKKHGVDIVLADLAYEAVLAGRVAANVLSVPLLVSIHDDPITRLENRQYSPMIVKKFKRDFSKTMTQAHKGSVISSYMAEKYEREYGLPCVVLYVGILEEDFFQPTYINKKQGEIIVGSVGSIHSAKNWQTLLDAVRLLNSSDGANTFKVLHIGKFPEGYTLTEDVELTGWVSDEEFVYHLNRVHIGFLNWSFEERHTEISRTSFPLKTRSYIQAQCPMIALGPGYSSIVDFVQSRGCGKVCTVPQATALADTIRTLVFDEQELKQAMGGVKKLRHDFSMQKFWASFEHFLGS